MVWSLGTERKSLSLTGKCSPVCTLCVKAPWGTGLSAAAFYRTSLEALSLLGAARNTKFGDDIIPRVGAQGTMNRFKLFRESLRLCLFCCFENLVV